MSSDPTLRTESLFQLTWPIFLQQTTQGTVILVDFWFFSHLSDRIAATVGQLLPIVWMGAFVIPSFAGAGVSVASQYMGARQLDRVVPAYMMNILCTTVMGLVFAVFLHAFASDIGRWMGLPPELDAIGTTYLSTMSYYFIFLGVLVAYAAVLSSRGMTNWLMYTTVTVASLNVTLASLFVFVFHGGLRGVISASVISVAVATMVAVWLVHGPLRVRFFLKGAGRAMLGVFRPMMRIGISNGFEPFSYTTQQIVIATMIIPLGVESMAASAYAARAQMFQIMFSVSLALGSQILMAHWMGARRFTDVDRLFWTVVRRGMCVAGVYALVAWLLADRVLGIFTHDAGIRALGTTLLAISICYEPARAVNIIGSSVLRTVGDARFPLVIAVVFIWGIIPVVILVNHAWPLTIAGFWMCFAADEIIRACINLWRWRTGRWKSMGIVRPLPPAPAAVASVAP